jgi:hypothetical protein
MSESANESEYTEAESDHSAETNTDTDIDRDESDNDNDSSDYEPDWIECICSRVDKDGLCGCKKEPAWELDSAGGIKSSMGFIDINVRLQVTKFHKVINTRPYFKSGKHLKLGDIVPTYGSRDDVDSIVVGWTKDDFIVMPTEKKYGKYCADERFFDSGEPKKIKGRVDLQPMLKQLADGIHEHF